MECKVEVAEPLLKPHNQDAFRALVRLRSDDSERELVLAVNGLDLVKATVPADVHPDGLEFWRRLAPDVARWIGGAFDSIDDVPNELGVGALLRSIDW